MQDKAKETLDDLKEIPGELRDRMTKGTEAFLERVRAPFEEAPEGEPPQHVVPREDRWAVLPQGSEKATKLFDTKEEAFEAAQKTAKRKETILIVHRKDGTVQETRNYRGR